MIVECKYNVIDRQNVAIEKSFLTIGNAVIFFKCVQLRSESGVYLCMCIWGALLNRILRISKFHTHKRIGTNTSHLLNVKFT